MKTVAKQPAKRWKYTMNNSDENKVQIYKRINKLKLKAGLGLEDNKVGVIDRNAIYRSQNIIDQKEAEYALTVKEILEKLTLAWEELKKSGGEERKELIDQIYNFSNNIKDLTATYRHDLMHHFSLSLRNFCEKIDVNKEEHHIIVEAHIDVMWITLKEKLRGEAGPKAEELKTIVARAIEKYFNN